MENKTKYAVRAWVFFLITIFRPGPVHGQGGVPLWTNRYAGPSNINSFASALVVDSSGKVYVTGNSGTVAYSGAGLPLWTNASEFGARAIAVDSKDNVFLTGGSWNGVSLDFVTIKYSGEGVPLWTNRYNGGYVNGLASDQAAAVAVDNKGNVFVAGCSAGNGFDDYATVAYSSSGVAMWTNRYDGANGQDVVTSMAVDGNGNVFVTGLSSRADGSFDYGTVAYSGGGLPLWTNRYNGSRNDEALAVAVDSSGNIFVTGVSQSNDINNSSDYVTIKYSSTGVPLWTRRFNSSGNYEDIPHAIAVDREGNVIVTGWSSNGTNEDYLTLKYSSAGTPLWTNRYNGTANGPDEALALAVDSSGNVIVTGVSYNDGWFNSSAYATVAYSSAGVPLWTNRYHGPGTTNDSAVAVATDSSGNAFVTGGSWNGSNFEYVTIKYSSSVVPRLDFQKLSNQLVLSWTNSNFGLQSAPTITGVFTNISGATSPYTNSLTGPQRFFRLATQ